MADEVHGVFGTDSEAHAEELGVAAQQVLIDLPLVLLGVGQEVRLVLQRALAEREPDGGEVALLAFQSEEPAVDRGIGVVVDGDSDGVLVELGCEPALDQRPVVVDVSELIGHSL